MTITASRGGSLAAASDDVILSQSTKLFEALNSNSSTRDNSKPSATLSGDCFDFSHSFPTYITNGMDPLPHSQALSQQGTYCTINYTLRVDVIRKGLRRHERFAFLSALASAERTCRSFLSVPIRITIPIMYLPRTMPPNQVQPVLVQDPLLDYEIEEGRFATVDLHNSGSAQAALDKLQVSAEVSYLSFLVPVRTLCKLTLCS